MKQGRIVKITNQDGLHWYVIQVKVWLFWYTQRDGYSESDIIYHSYDQAKKDLIELTKPKYKIKDVIEYVPPKQYK